MHLKTERDAQNHFSEEHIIVYEKNIMRPRVLSTSFFAIFQPLEIDT